MGYSLDLRIRVIEAYERGEGSFRELAKRFSVHWRTVSNWLVRFRREGSAGPRQQSKRGPDPALDQAGLEALALLIKEKPDSTLEELSERLEEKLELRLSTSTLSRALRKLDLTYKKRPRVPRKPTRPRSGSSSGSTPSR